MKQASKQKRFQTATRAMKQAVRDCRKEPSACVVAKMHEMRRLIHAICQETYEEATNHWREALQAVTRFRTEGGILAAAHWLATKLQEDGVSELKRIAMFAAAVDLMEREDKKPAKKRPAANRNVESV